MIVHLYILEDLILGREAVFYELQYETTGLLQRLPAALDPVYTATAGL